MKFNYFQQKEKEKNQNKRKKEKMDWQIKVPSNWNFMKKIFTLVFIVVLP